MTFTAYDPDETTERDQVRGEIGDTVENAGPRPNKTNFSDEVIARILTVEGNVNGAIARCFERLRAEWTPYSLSERRDVEAFDAKGLVDKYEKLADDWRAKTGGGTNTIFAGVVGLDIAARGDDYPND